MFDLEEEIIKLVNEAMLPLEAKYYVVQAVELRLKEALLNQKIENLKEANNEQMSQQP